VETDDVVSGAAAASVFLLFCALIVAFIATELLGGRRARAHGKRGKAEQRAYALLKEWLSTEQLARFESHGHFEVQGSHSGKCYRIRPDRFMNIDELDKNGTSVAVWCVGPAGCLPIGDAMLAQKIALETDEQAVLAVANRSR
jgi:hypothetical protein